MRLINLDDVTIETIKSFKDSFKYEKETIHGSHQLQQANDLHKWMKEIIRLKEKNYQQAVQTSHFALITDDNVMIGISDVKHHLTSYLQKEGGHISYTISPNYQGQGFGTALLKETLKEAQKIGLTSIHLTVKETNEASQKIIEKNNGRKIREIRVNHYNVWHYQINLDYNNNIM
ncbi:GNAT family N-acetyltransferase [Vagococcus teuberi]